MGQIDLPSKAVLGRIAETRPELLNLLVAYFVFEWRSVKLGTIPHGEDQTGKTRLVPQYVAYWGVDACIHYLLQSPARRGSEAPGLITSWLKKISNS